MAHADSNMNPKDEGKAGNIDFEAAPYFTWMPFAFSIARTTTPRMIDISKTVERGKRNSGRISHLVNDQL